MASAIGDLSDLTAGDTRDVSVSGVFSDLDGDALTITAGSSDDAVATVVVLADQSTLTLTGVAEGTTTITVTAEDADGNRVSDAFDVTVAAPSVHALRQRGPLRRQRRRGDRRVGIPTGQERLALRQDQLRRVAGGRQGSPQLRLIPAVHRLPLLLSLRESSRGR